MNGRRLYEEIGGVSERYLQEASNYRPQKRYGLWRVALIAAAVSLVVAMVLGTLALSMGLILLGLPDHEPEQPAQQPEYKTVAAMESAMQERQGTLPGLESEELAYFDGAYKLIWCESGSDAYYSVSLSEGELGYLLALMQSPREAFTERSEQPDMQLWICLGDGVVISPYLKNTAGNTGHGEVFDYHPELEMSPALTAYIAECVLT